MHIRRLCPPTHAGMTSTFLFYFFGVAYFYNMVRPNVFANASDVPNTSALLNCVAQSSSFGNFMLLHLELMVELLQVQHALERAEKEKRHASDRAFLVESNITVNKQFS